MKMCQKESFIVCLVIALVVSGTVVAAPPPVILTVNIVGSGTVDPPGGSYARRTVVTLTAESESGWYFDHWEGDLSGSDNPTTITMQGNKTVTAVFLEGTPEFTTIFADDANLQYVGRILFDDPMAPQMTWTGTAVIANFEGTSVKVKLDDSGDNFFRASVDDGEPVIIECLGGNNTYTVATGLSDTVHKLELSKRTEVGKNGMVRFTGLVIDGGKSLVSPPARPDRRIEFYGDSITVGLALESTGDDQSAQYTNNYLSYCALTARYFDAEMHCIAISGIGLIHGYGSGNMPTDYYWRHEQTDAGLAWDFTSWVPHVVCINLGQNDYWLSNHTAEENIQAYIDFVQDLRVDYPVDTPIFLCLGSMNATEPGSPWPGYIQEAVNRLNTTYNDPYVWDCIFPYDGLGTHPHAPQHQAMADQLTALINQHVSWGGECGNGTCEPGENQCNCPDDCGTPPATETSCDDDVDNDCDGYTDCDDIDCEGDPVCPSGGTIFADDFESGSFSTGGWTIVAGSPAVHEQAPYTGVYGVKFYRYSAIEKAVSTIGKSSIFVEYDRRTDGYDPEDFFEVEWYDGASWNLLESTQDSSWGHPVFALPAGADNNPDFIIRFTSNVNRPTDKAYLDNVEILD